MLQLANESYGEVGVSKEKPSKASLAAEALRTTRRVFRNNDG